MKKFKFMLIPVLCAIMAIVIFRTVFIIGYVPSESMEPTLKKDSLILGIRFYGELSDGNIIIFRRDEKLLVKRIAASEGETIIHNGAVIVVPKNCFYVLGDNSDNSFDSRYWEYPYVKRKDILAEVVFIQK